jgi:alpha-methylacyl-CoA racemase
MTTGPMQMLAGVRVVEIGGLGPGPFAGMVLADHGADVVTLKRPDYVKRMYEGKTLLERGKRDEIVDLKSEAGRRRARELIAAADVTIEGFRPGTAERLGLGPADCSALNPRIVYARMTGWGQDGPLAQLGGHDINYIGVAGYLAQVGRAGGQPTPPLNIVGDFGGGGLLLAFGIATALFEVQRTGRGKVIDAAMVDGVALLMASYYTLHMRLGPRGTNLFDSGAPFYDTYRTADGGYMAVGATGTDLYATLLKTLGIDPSELPDQHDESGWPKIRERLCGVFATKTRDDWTAVFATVDAAVTPVLDPYEAVDHPHLRERGVFVDAGGYPAPGPAPRFSDLPGGD